MPGPVSPIANQTETSALVSKGRGEGLAMAALALSIVSFVNMLGAEKAILAIVLAVLARRGAQSSISRRQSGIAIVLASAYIATFMVVLLLFHDKLGQLIHLLQTLG